MDNTRKGYELKKTTSKYLMVLGAMCEHEKKSPVRVSIWNITNKNIYNFIKEVY